MFFSAELVGDKMNLHMIFGQKIDFFELMEEQTYYIIRAINALTSYAKTLNTRYADLVKALEKQADGKRAELVKSLNKTFITPYDREDIFMLSKSIDDIMDYYKSTVKEMEIYQIEQTPELVEFLDALKLASSAIYDSICNMKDKPSAAVKAAIRAKKSENQVESIYRHSVATLLMSDDAKYIIKMRELYRHLSNCADKIDQTADLVCQILMKETS